MKLTAFAFIVSVWVAGIISTASAGLPGYRDVSGPVTTPEQAHKILFADSAKSSTLAAKGSATASEEIKSLVRGLKNNPDQVMEWLGTDQVGVKVHIEGTDYMFDPSMKAHTHHPGIDIETTIGFDKSTFTSHWQSNPVHT